MDRKKLFNYFLEKKILTKSQLEHCIQKSASDPISFEESVIQQGYLSKKALQAYLQSFQKTIVLDKASPNELKDLLQKSISIDEQSTILEELESWSEKTGFSKEKKNSTTDTRVTPEKLAPSSKRERTREESEKSATTSFRERFNTQRYEILETLVL